MPTCPRRDIVAEDTVGVFHCYNRCVRQAWLCGADPVTGQNFEHRRQWIVDREQELARLFGIEIGFHCEMANHLHLILRTRPDVVETWSDQDVVRRWLCISRLTHHFANTPLEVSEAEVRFELARPKRVTVLRGRLSSISWFMGCLTQYIATRANHEDECKGRFFEGRFKCRNLADERSILICGMYVDLNPIHAGEAMVPEEARYTSAYHRIQGLQQRAQSANADGRCDQSPEASPSMPADGWLCELTVVESPPADVRQGLQSQTPWRASDKGLLPISLQNYLSLLDWTGRQLRGNKRGAIPAHLAGILERLGIRPAYFLDSVRHFDKWFGPVIGGVQHLLAFSARTARGSVKGLDHCEKLFG